MIVGNERGGMSGFQTPLRLDSTSPAREASLERVVSLFPNPAKEWLDVHVDAEGDKQLWLFNASGQLVVRQEWIGAGTQAGCQQAAGRALFCEGICGRRGGWEKGAGAVIYCSSTLPAKSSKNAYCRAVSLYCR
ncbi:MAG: hypothetical protein H6559_34700 [Lewinellaceae bacterium]|nr:hypothetical protein [Lewinellaceae bacterium]